MTQQYKFTVTKYSNNSNKDYLFGEAIILAQSDNFTNNFYMTLKLDSVNSIVVEAIEIAPTSNFSTNERRENAFYLQGYFDFKTHHDVIDALINLKNALNSDNFSEFFSVKWDTFTIEFKNWFKTKLSPLLLEESAIRKRVHKNEK